MTLTDIAVDFKDGQGFHLIPVNGTVSKTYTDSSSRKIIDFRAHLSTGAYVYCHSSVDVFVTASGMGNRYAGGDPYSREVPVPVVAGEGLGGDVMQIRYSINNPTRTNATPHLRKPLIYVEGYDVSGKYNILNLISDPTGEWPQLLNLTGYDFMHYLDDVAGYDLVFVNYNTLRSFEDNSKMLQHVIEWVKQDKTAGGYSAQNVMIGISAGGVLARYTLARMTKTISSASTDTRLLITHDSPHQGANVPLAFQHFLYDLGNVQVLGNKIKDNLEDLKNFFVLNALPATAQLLKARVTDENGTVVMNTFLNGPSSPYQQMIKFAPTDNQPIYGFIATAQGSQCGVPVMSSNSLPLADYDGDFAIVRWKLLFLPRPYKTQYFLTTQLTALPSTGSQIRIEYFKYNRRFSYWGIGFGTKTLKEVSRNNPAGFTDWDAAPGSTQSINDRTNGALTTGLTKQKLSFIATSFVRLRAGLNMNVTQDLFSFVSTTSSLDAPPGTPLNMTYLYQLTGTTGTSSQKYIAQEKFTTGGSTYYNQNHTDFTARNSRWIYNEMEAITQPTDCNDFCNASNIQGNDILCSTPASYTVTPLFSGSTVTWSALPLNIVQFGCNTCASTTLTKQGNGIVTITANVTNSCGNGTASKVITVGSPQPGPITFPLIDPIIGKLQAQVDPVPGATSYNWYKNGVLQTGHGEFIQMAITRNLCNVYYDISVAAINNCGTSAQTHKEAYVPPCDMAFTISPNPASTSINIMPNTNSQSLSTATIDEIRIYDLQGTLKKYQAYSNATSATINIQGLISGSYIVQITSGTLQEKHQLIIQN